MKRIVGVLGLFLAAAGLLAAQTVQAGGGGGGHYYCDNDKKVTQVNDSAAFEVAVRDACFGPVIARVAPGTELRWTNRGQMPHNIVDVNAPAKTEKMLQPGASVSMTFAQAGAFVYYCSMHPGMVGTVFVGDSLADANPEVTSSAAASARTPPQDPLAPRVASAQFREGGSDGMAAQTVILLALVVGVVAGGGSTLLTRRLDRN